MDYLIPRPLLLGFPPLQLPLDLFAYLVGAKTILENHGCHGGAQGAQVPNGVFSVDLELRNQPAGRVCEEAGYRLISLRAG